LKTEYPSERGERGIENERKKDKYKYRNRNTVVIPEHGVIYYIWCNMTFGSFTLVAINLIIEKKTAS
jgi:hypothetical protein